MSDIPKSNITDFLTSGKDILIISDIEGLNPSKQINKITDFISNNNAKYNNGVIYNGDVFDYTGPSTLDKQNCCAMKMLKILVDAMEINKAVCQVGNRDLNKIKMLALNLSKDITNKWWCNGSTIEEISINLVNKVNSEGQKFWLFEDLQVINPFWGNSELLKTEWKCQDKPNNTTLIERFNTIFGIDTKIGTMSAQNTITYLPMELGIQNNDTEFNAAIVMTVFARLLDPDLCNSETQSTIQYGDLGNLDGYLYKYLTKALPSTYGYIDNTLFLFSHGGISKDFTSTSTNKNGTEKKIEEDGIYMLKQINDELIAKLSLIRNPEDCGRPQSGGGDTVIENKINSFNDSYMELINNLFNSYSNILKNANTNSNRNSNTNSNRNSNTMRNDVYSINDNNYVLYGKTMFILLSLCAPVDNNKTFKEYFTQNNFNQYKTSLSPIQVPSPITDNILSDANVARDIKIINVFSHIPKGIGYSFGKIADNMYFINTDFSNSCMKDTMLLKTDRTLTEKDPYNDNYLLLYLRSFKESGVHQYTLTLEGELNINSQQNYPILNGTYNNVTIETINTFSEFKNGLLLPLSLKPKESNSPTILPQLKINFKETMFSSLNIDTLFNGCYSTSGKNDICLHISKIQGLSSLYYGGVVSINDSQNKYKLITKPIVKPPNFYKVLGFIEVDLHTQNGGRRKSNKKTTKTKTKSKSKNKSKRVQTRKHIKK